MKIFVLLTAILLTPGCIATLGATAAVLSAASSFVSTLEDVKEGK